MSRTTRQAAAVRPQATVRPTNLTAKPHHHNITVVLTAVASRQLMVVSLHTVSHKAMADSLRLITVAATQAEHRHTAVSPAEAIPCSAAT